jgi:hypothetical protein
MLKVIVVLVDSFKFPGFILSWVSQVLFFNLLFLEIVNGLRIPMQLKLVILKAIFIVIVL